MGTKVIKSLQVLFCRYPESNTTYCSTPKMAKSHPLASTHPTFDCACHFNHPPWKCRCLPKIRPHPCPHISKPYHEGIVTGKCNHKVSQACLDNFFDNKSCNCIFRGLSDSLMIQQGISTKCLPCGCERTWKSSWWFGVCLATKRRKYF